MVQDYSDHGDDLHHHLELSQVAGFDGKALGGRDGAQATYQKFASNDDHGDPCRYQTGIKLH